MTENTYETECDECGETVAMTKVKTLDWTNRQFCSFTCRDRYQSKTDRLNHD